MADQTDQSGRGPFEVGTPEGGEVPLRDFSRSLPMSLLRAREAVMAHFRPGLHEAGITEQQWRVLRALSGVDRIEVLALARLTFLLPPSLSRILRDLERRGLIARRTSDADQRRGLISIGTPGLDLLARAGLRSEAIYAEIGARFGQERLEALQQMLGALEDLLAAPMAANAAARGTAPDTCGNDAGGND